MYKSRQKKLEELFERNLLTTCDRVEDDGLRIFDFQFIEHV